MIVTYTSVYYSPSGFTVILIPSLVQPAVLFFPVKYGDLKRNLTDFIINQGGSSTLIRNDVTSVNRALHVLCLSQYAVKKNIINSKCLNLNILIIVNILNQNRSQIVHKSLLVKSPSQLNCNGVNPATG